MVILEFFKFLLNPDCERKSIGIKARIFKFVVLFIFSVIINYSLIFLLKSIVNLPFNKITELSIGIVIVYGGVIAPICEELAFRLGLIYSKLNFSISFSLVVTFLVKTLLNFRLISLIGASSFFALFLVLFLITFYALNKFEIINNRLAFFWKKSFRWVFYLSAILFGTIHITNWEINSVSSMFMIPILILPQIIGGLFLGFVRIKLGFAWAVMFHIFNNLIPFLIIYF